MTENAHIKKINKHNRFFAFLMAFILIFTPFANTTKARAALTGIVNTDGLNVRKKASTNADVITSLSVGKKVTILNQKTNKKERYGIRFNLKQAITPIPVLYTAFT